MLVFDDGAVTLYGRLFQGVCLTVIDRLWSPTTPTLIEWVWAFPRSLATTRGISFDFFSSATEMFQFAE